MLPQTRTPWRAGSLAVPRALRGGPFRENPSGFRSPDCRRSVSILGCSAVDATSSRRPAVEHVQGQRKKRRSVTQVAKAAKDFLDGEIQAKQPSDPDPSLYNEDFAPTPADGRTFGWFDLMTLWVGLVVSVPSYCLASSLVDLGLSWSQGVLNIFISNVVVLVPMVLTAHPGTKYGVPFPVLTRASFGVRGAHVPSLLRSLVACGWFGIQTWVGGSSIHTLLAKLSPAAVSPEPVAWLGIKASEFACFLVFWAVQLGIVVNGLESIRILERYSAPVLIGLSLSLLLWAYLAAGGLGPMLAAPSQFAVGMPKAGQFWQTFLPALTANVGYWATLSLNIPDFSRLAKSQRAQVVGQAVGLPFFMAAFTFIGLAVTSATITIYGVAVTDPVEVVAKMSSVPALIASLIGLMLATLSTNIAANVVAPANAFVNLAPQRVSFRLGAIITATAGLVICPWNLIANTQGYIFTWLIGYSALLGSVGGVLLADYYIVRNCQLDVDALYSTDPSQTYWYRGGYNPAALWALLIGIAPNVPGFLHAAGLLQSIPSALQAIYQSAWFVAFLLSMGSYVLLMGIGSSPATGGQDAAPRPAA